MRESKKLHIMHLLLSLQTGGCENGIVNLMNHMDPERFKVSVCCLEDIGELAQRILPDRRHLHLVRKEGRPRIRDLHNLSALFREEGVDIVHTHAWATVALGYASAKLAGVPVVIHGEHGGLHIANRFQVMAQKMLFRMVDTTVTVSADLQTRLAGIFKVNPARFHPIINGVDTSRFVFRNRQGRETVRERHGISEEACVIGSVGRLVSWKRQDVLLNAVAELIRRGRDVVLVLVGDGPCRSELEELAARKGVAGRIILAGRRDDVTDYLAAMDVFALTSSASEGALPAPGDRALLTTEFEGISNAMLEAMACGLPVVASNVGGTKEIVVHGDSGYLFEPDDLDALRDSLDRLVSNRDLCSRLGTSARRSMEENFSLSSMVRGYQELYLDIAGKKGIL